MNILHQLNRTLLIQFTKFAMIGVLNTLIHFTLFWLLTKINIHYMIASTFGYLAGLVNSYLMNRTWTFKSTETKNIHIEASRFVIVNILALMTNLALMHLFVSKLAMNKNLSQIIAIVFVLVVNFAGNKLWTFKTKAVG